MIFVIDDNVLHVHTTQSELQGEYEGIDVENGEYQFFDEAGLPLEAVFDVPNSRQKILFGMLEEVYSGTYRLVPTQKDTQSNLIEILDSLSGLEENSHFRDLIEVGRFLTRGSL